jgi:hypothetical protein
VLALDIQLELSPEFTSPRIILNCTYRSRTKYAEGDTILLIRFGDFSKHAQFVIQLGPGKIIVDQ